jgi:ABC-type nitrate/sulfonate/bicarbonate transport system permease component
MPNAGAGTMRVNIPGLMTIAVCAILWEALVRGGAVNYAYLPAPSAILFGLYTLIFSGQFWADIAHTVQAVIIGWVIASIIGLALGLFLGVSPLLRKYSLASIEVLRPMPAIAFVPVALLLFGFSLKTELVVIVLPALWPVLINTMGGVSTIHRRLFDVGATFRLSRASILRKIVIPATLPPILVGLRLSLTLALVLAIVAEMVGNPTGLGYAVVRDQQALQPALMFADVIVIGVLGIVLNQALLQITWRLFPAASQGIRR